LAVDLSKLVVKRKITLEELNGKTVAIDAYNVLYQFLSIIRQPDGTPLMDSHGNVTSHLSGLFYRTIELVENGITPIYVFDGLPSILKQKTLQSRMKRREVAFEAWEKAKAAGETEDAKRYAQASTKINKYVVESSKVLLDHIGIMHINAPGEGEAEASHLCIKGEVDAAASQDYDTLLFGSPTIVRNLTISGRRKLPKKNVFVNIEPEMVLLEETLKSVGVSRKQLIWIGILLGTDFNEGIKGIGPVTAVKIAKEAKSISDIKQYVKGKYNQDFELDIQEVEDLFIKPEVVDVDIEQLKKESPQIDRQAAIDFMCKEHEFSEDRIGKFIDKLSQKTSSTKQNRIEKWF
jgi:flap endonuclease-1